jgi:hypothetical protein
MDKNSRKNCKSNNNIDKIEVTTDVLTGRAGLALFVRYLNTIGVFSRLIELFVKYRKSGKGQTIGDIFKQMFCFFMDGTSRHLVYFDTLKADEGYARCIETDPGHMLSSHAVKRFFKPMNIAVRYAFRKVLMELFLWRLHMVKPDVILLGIDSMVMDNDEALKRQGVKPTYKKVKGYQPLQMTWSRFVIDAIFRSGDRHCNHADQTREMADRIVSAIRKRYRADVVIIIRMDSGFFDQELFDYFEKNHIGYICGGKIYDDVKTYVKGSDRSFWGRHQNKDQVWEYVEMGDRRGSWHKFRRAFYCRPLYEGRQLVFDFQRPDTMIYTNLGVDPVVAEGLCACGRQELMKPQAIIAGYHERGGDELVHRALKDFGFEALPFQGFGQNNALYYTMLMAFFLYESFKEDVCSEVVPVSAYATTLRRKIIDFAAKIVKHSGHIALKVNHVVLESLKLVKLWEKSASAQPAY